MESTVATYFIARPKMKKNCGRFLLVLVSMKGIKYFHKNEINYYIFLSKAKNLKKNVEDLKFYV
jgi:hypothetical protein